MRASATPGLCRGLFSDYRIRCFAQKIIMMLGIVSAFVLSGTAQSPVSGSFAGTVTEKTSGTRISGALVTFRNQDTGSQTTAVSGPDGQFLKTSLSPGFYEIEVRADGYLPEKKRQRLLATRENSVVPVPFELLKPVATATPTPAPTTTPNQLAEFTTATDEDQAIVANPRRDGAFDARSI